MQRTFEEGRGRGKGKLGSYNAAINGFLVRGPIKTLCFGLLYAGNPGITDCCGFMWRLEGGPHILILVTYTTCASAFFYYYYFCFRFF